MDAHSLCNGCGERTGTPVQCMGDCAHVQRKLKLFDEIYKDNSSAVQLRDPGIRASKSNIQYLFHLKMLKVAASRQQAKRRPRNHTLKSKRMGQLRQHKIKFRDGEGSSSKRSLNRESCPMFGRFSLATVKWC